MTHEKMPEALRLADDCEESANNWLHEVDTRLKAAKMLRAQHARVAELESQLAAEQRVPLSDQLPRGFLSDVLTAAGLVSHGKQCKALGSRIGEAVEAIWKISIKKREAIAATGEAAMTHTSTEQELYEQWLDDYALTYEPNYDEHLEADCRAAFLAGMQAARRAQVVPNAVTPAMVDAAVEAYMPFGDMEIAIACALAAAPQPPEVAQLDDMDVVDITQPVDLKEAAPVRMPEPVAFALEWTFNGEERGMRLYDDETHCRFDAESDGGVCHALYTEHQVRQLLAAHGIK